MVRLLSLDYYFIIYFGKDINYGQQLFESMAFINRWICDWSWHIFSFIGLLGATI